MQSSQLLADEDTITDNGELNLGLGSLIAIFFGLALGCGVFFGFGYTLGHRKPGVDPSAEASAAATTIQVTAPKPSAQRAEQPSDANRVIVPKSSGEADQQPAAGATPTPSAQSSRAVSLPPAPTPEPATMAVGTPAARLTPATASVVTSGPLTAATAGSLMVQIAAVKNRPDAEALASALQRNGFHPTIRTESQDKLLHVQVGPFDNRDDARAMRQKLSNAGYNAFIK